MSKPGTQSEDDDDKKSSYIHDSQVYMEIFCGLLEKLYHIYRWERPQITTTIVICLSLSKQSLSSSIRGRLNRYRRKRPKVDASIFDSALSHTRRSDASDKKRRK